MPDRTYGQMAFRLDGHDHAALGVGKQLHQAREGASQNLIELTTASE